MSQGTFKIEIDGDVNLMTALVNGGYKGTARLSSLFIVNENDASVFVNLTESGTVPPGSPEDGTAIGNLNQSVEYRLEDSMINAPFVWLFSNSAIEVVITAIGDGI